MPKLDFIELKNNSSLNQVFKGNGPSFIFFPGGPGLGSECFEALFQSTNNITGSIFTFNYPVDISQLSDEKIFMNIKDDIYEVLTKLHDVALVGHSFGGMLLQCLDFSKYNLRNIVLLNSSPTIKCFELALITSEKFNDEEKSNILTATEDYQTSKSNSTFKSMFKAWAPYYVTPPFQSQYELMLDRSKLNFALYEWGERYFFSYFKDNVIKNHKYIIISSKSDSLCPISLFDESEYQNNTKIILKSSSHFPWLDNMDVLKIISEKV